MSDTVMFGRGDSRGWPKGGTFNPWEHPVDIEAGIYADDHGDSDRFTQEHIPYGERLETIMSSDFSSPEADDQRIKPEDVIFLVEVKSNGKGITLKPQSQDNDLLCEGRKSKRIFHLSEGDVAYLSQSEEKAVICREDHRVVSDKLDSVSFVTVDIYVTIMRKLQ